MYRHLEKKHDMVCAPEECPHCHRKIETHKSVNHFGSEDMTYIGGSFFKECFEKGKFGIMNFLEKLYFDRDNPQNHNIHWLKNNVVEIFICGKWIPRKLSDVVNSMTDAALRRITTHPSIKPSHMTEAFLVQLNDIGNLDANMKGIIQERVKMNLMIQCGNIDREH
jgi:hypothetical protein